MKIRRLTRPLLLCALCLLPACSAPAPPASPGIEYPEHLRANIIELEERLRLTPDDAARTAQLIRLYTAAGVPDRAQARGALFLAAVAGPASLPVRFALADAAAAATDWQAALDILRAAGHLTGDTVATRLNCAIIAERSGDRDGARTLLDEAVLLTPGLPLPLRVRGDFRLRNSDLPGAAADYHAALNARPADAALLLRLGLLAGASGDYREAARCCQDVILHEQERTPLAGEAFLTLARIALTAGTVQETRHYLGRAAALLPDQAEPLELLARLELRQEQPYAALELLNRALVIDPVNAAACELQGDIMLRLSGMNDEALACYQRAVRLAPHRSASHLKIAALLLGRNDAAGARRELAAVRDDNPFMGELVRFNRGVLDALAGDTTAATRAFATVADLSPLYVRAQYNLARLAVAAGDGAAAAHATAAVSARQPHAARALNNLGVAWAVAGDTVRARGLFVEALAGRELPELTSNLHRVKGS